MPTFHFTGTSTASSTSTTLSSLSSISAFVSTSSNGVNFTFSLTAINTAPFPTPTFVTITDTVGSGISGLVSFSSSVSFTVSLLVSFTGAPTGTVFSSNPIVDGTFGSGSAAPGVNGNQLQFAIMGFGNNARFSFNSINALLCFTGGTNIATPTGAVPVEELTEGDMVLTADGRETPVRWLGRSPVDTRLAHPARVNPIRITAGALGNGLPRRDLRLSPDHAIEIDGTLCNAGALVNGSTIWQERGKMPDGFAYYHVETDAHELLLAEGVAAESFIDYAGRDSFENSGEATAHIREMDLPRISSARLVPGHIRERLAPLPIAAE